MHPRVRLPVCALYENRPSRDSGLTLFFPNPSACWLFNVANEAKTLERCFGGDHSVTKTPGNSQSLTRHLTHLHQRMDDFMKQACRRDFGLEPLRVRVGPFTKSHLHVCRLSRVITHSHGPKD